MLSKTKFSDALTTRPLCPGSKKRERRWLCIFYHFSNSIASLKTFFSLFLFEIEIKFSRLSSFLVSLSFLSIWFYKNFFLQKRKKIEKEGQRRNSWQLDIKWTFAEVKGLLCLTPSLSISLLHAHPHIHTRTHFLIRTLTWFSQVHLLSSFVRSLLKINSRFSFAQIRPHKS